MSDGDKETGEGRPPRFQVPPTHPVPHLPGVRNREILLGATPFSKTPGPPPSFPEVLSGPKAEVGEGMRRGRWGSLKTFSGLEGLEGPRAGGFRAVGGGLQTSRG